MLPPTTTTRKHGTQESWKMLWTRRDCRLQYPVGRYASGLFVWRTSIMTRALAALGALAVVLAMMSPCLAQAGGGTAEAAPPAKSEYGQFAALPSLVKLTDEQQTKIKEAVAAANKTLLPDTEKMQKLAGDLGKANADGKKEEAQAIQMEMMTIGPRLQKGYAELGEKVLSALTDDQKLSLRGW